MPIVPVVDTYVDEVTTVGTSWSTHTVCPLGDGRFVTLTKKQSPVYLPYGLLGMHDPTDPLDGMQGRVYTMSANGFTRGAPSYLTDFPSVKLRACAATMDGNVLTQYDNGNHGGYVVHRVDGTGLEPGAPLALSDSSWAVPPYSNPEAMARIPGTNRFWAWRHWPAFNMLRIDVLQVTGTAVTLVASAVVPTTSSYDAVDVPRAIVPISGSEAISLVTAPYSGSVVLHHLALSGTTITDTRTTVNGYYHDRDLSLYPASYTGSACDAEFLVWGGTSIFDTTTTIIRVGVKWVPAAGQFTITALPLTQLGTPKPSGYSGDAAVRLTQYVRSLAVGQYLYTCRPLQGAYRDDNWILFTQYDLVTGKIVAQVWQKGDRNGDTTDSLHVVDTQLEYDTKTARMIFSALEQFSPDTLVNDPATRWDIDRLGAYRLSYDIDASLLNQRESFER